MCVRDKGSAYIGGHIGFNVVVVVVIIVVVILPFELQQSDPFQHLIRHIIIIVELLPLTHN